MSTYYTYPIFIWIIMAFVEVEFEVDVYIANVRAQLRLIDS